MYDPPLLPVADRPSSSIEDVAVLRDANRRAKLPTALPAVPQTACLYTSAGPAAAAYCLQNRLASKPGAVRGHAWLTT